jgi:hypothetical protein
MGLDCSAHVFLGTNVSNRVSKPVFSVYHLSCVPSLPFVAYCRFCVCPNMNAILIQRMHDSISIGLLATLRLLPTKNTVWSTALANRRFLLHPALD